MAGSTPVPSVRCFCVVIFCRQRLRAQGSCISLVNFSASSIIKLTSQNFLLKYPTFKISVSFFFSFSFSFFWGITILAMMSAIRTLIVDVFAISYYKEPQLHKALNMGSEIWRRESHLTRSYPCNSCSIRLLWLTIQLHRVTLHVI